MRIIAFGDIHMATSTAGKIPGIGNADMVIATGDLTNYGKRKEAKQVLDQLLSYNRNLLAVFGNLDNFDIDEYLEQLGMNLHGQARLLHSRVCLVGSGGSNLTPFGTPGEYTEKEIAENLKTGYQQAKEFISLARPFAGDRIPLLLVSHVPPRETRVDRLHNGKHVGSRAVREFIENHQPDLCITGHIHEARGEDRIGSTHIINPGMLKNGGWVDINIHQSTVQATLI